MKTKIHSHVQNGQLIQNRSKLFESIAKFEGKNITITVERKKEKRSNNANAYYWGVVVKMIKMVVEEQTGEIVTAQDVHDLLKGQFNSKSIIKGDIDSDLSIVKIPQSTATLSVPGFAKYVENCRLWANDFFDIEIPEPNEEISEHIDEDFEK